MATGKKDSLCKTLLQKSQQNYLKIAKQPMAPLKISKAKGAFKKVLAISGMSETSDD